MLEGSDAQVPADVRGAFTTSAHAATYEDAMLGRVEASIMGESALIDREMGRVFWEGGSSTTLVESILTANLDRFGAEHAQAALLTAFITVVFLGVLAGWLRQILIVPSSSETSSRLAQFSHVVLANTLFRMPRLENKWLVAVTIALYVLESYNCSTRRFLANSIDSPTEVEAYIEHLRSQEPVVTWVVRSFHHRKRRIFTLTEVIQSLFRKGKSQTFTNDIPAVPSSKKCAPSFPFTKKVVTHEATTNYRYQSCIDNTVAGVWRRADAASPNLAPFTRIIINKLLVLSDRQTREDYFRQQSNFVTEHGRGDEFTEFSTEISVPGYRPRMLAVRSIQGISSAKLFRLHLFWFFTFCGLTVPYRIWFKRHCDSLRVTVVKETSAIPPSSSYWDRASRWMPSRATISPPHIRNDTSFRSYMRGRSLYTSGISHPKAIFDSVIHDNPPTPDDSSSNLSQQETMADHSEGESSTSLPPPSSHSTL